MKERAFISQPLLDKSEEDIIATYERAKSFLENLGYEVTGAIDFQKDPTLAEKGVFNIPLFYLARSITEISRCNLIYFCDGWETARGCVVEHKAAEMYGMQILYECAPYLGADLDTMKKM